MIRAKTVLWAAGVQPSSLGKSLEDVELDPSGRVKVLADLSLKNHPEVFVVGDQASFTTEKEKHSLAWRRLRGKKESMQLKIF